MHRTSLKLIRLQNIASPPSRPSLLKRSISAFGRFVRVVVFDVERGANASPVRSSPPEQLQISYAVISLPAICARTVRDFLSLASEVSAGNIDFFWRHVARDIAHLLVDVVVPGA